MPSLFEPLEDEDVKRGPKSATPGGQITYTITYGNNQLQPVNLIVREQYYSRTVFVDSHPLPDPGTNNIWTFRDLPPGKHGQIKIIMRTIKPAARADINGEVQGTGFTSTRGKLSTDFVGYTVTNNVQISSAEFRVSPIPSTL